MRLLAALLLLPMLAWAEPAITTRQVELKKAPAAEGETIAQLAENTAVESLERRGGWTRVKTADGEGWVRMVALRFTGPRSLVWPAPSSDGPTPPVRPRPAGVASTPE